MSKMDLYDAQSHESPAVNEDEPQRLNRREWRRRLQAARIIAIERLAAVGLDVERGDEPIAGVLEGPLGASLVPALATQRERLNRLIEKLNDRVRLEDTLVAYSSALTEAAFMLGVITGAHTSWPVIEAMPAPFVPITTKKAKRIQ